MTDDDRFAGWLSCPDCERDLEPVAPDAVGCSSGHRFAANRRGYLGLLSEGWKLSAAGHPVEVPGDAALGALRAMLPRRGRVLELHASGPDDLVTSADAPGVTASVLSTSPRILERVVAQAGVAAILADPVRRWPIRDGSVSALVIWGGSLAPAEFHRVLAAGGALLLCASVRDADAVVDDLYPWFEHDQTRPVGTTGRTALRLRRRRRMLTW